MPTPPPDPIQDPSSGAEQLARDGAIEFVGKFFERLSGPAYNTRSHMPAGLDHTDFTRALAKVGKFCKARPDWTLIALEPLMTEAREVRHNAAQVLREIAEKLER